MQNGSEPEQDSQRCVVMYRWEHTHTHTYTHTLTHTRTLTHTHTPFKDSPPTALSWCFPTQSTDEEIEAWGGQGSCPGPHGHR